VGMQFVPLCGTGRSASQAVLPTSTEEANRIPLMETSGVRPVDLIRDAERRGLHSFASRGNDKNLYFARP